MYSFKQLQNLVSSKLTWEVFETVLKKQQNSDNVKLIKITYGKPAKKGDSYLSCITRFTIEYSAEISGTSNNYKLHVIAKSLMKNIAQRKTFRISDFFTNEIVFYKEVWPQLDAFQKDIQPEQIFEEIPNYLHGYFDGSNDYILLEDLSFENYQALDRAGTLTYETAKLILKILSRFHALGFAFREANPQLFEETALKLKETLFHEDIRKWYSKFHNNLKNVTLDAIEQELSQFYANKIKEIFSRDIYGEAIQLCGPSANSKFRTITQGDTWMPNFLTRYDAANNPEHSVMLDFQLSRYASLAQDLHFFIYACTDANMRSEHYENMLKFYCKEFNEYFAELRPQQKNAPEPVLSFEDLITELRLNGIYALCVGMEAGIMGLLDDDEVSDLDQIKGEDALPLDLFWIVKPLKTKEKRIKVAQFVKHLIDNNFI